VGKKPNYVFVGEGGEVDAGCRGKNAWDEAIRDYTPRMLDMSCTTWSKQDPFAVRKLREALDTEFEYRGQPLSMVGFRTAIIKFMKSERSRLKVKWLAGLVTCPDHINGTQWGRLKDYWDTPAQRLKALKMKTARRSVKPSPVLGRKGKAGKEATLVLTALPSSYFSGCYLCLFFHSAIDVREVALEHCHEVPMAVNSLTYVGWTCAERIPGDDSRDL
jgi:hypothetical protein